MNAASEVYDSYFVVNSISYKLSLLNVEFVLF